MNIAASGEYFNKAVARDTVPNNRSRFAAQQTSTALMRSSTQS